VEGLLQDFHLNDMLQLFELSQKTGTIELFPIGYQQQGSNPNPAFPIGRIYLIDGQITDAQLSTLRGEDALFSLFLWQAGTFLFINAASSPTRTITQTNGSLLMEGVRRIDEWASILEHVPTLQITIFCPPTPPPNTQAMKLTDIQWRFLQNLHGYETVASVARRCGISPFQARILATRLLALGLIKRRPPTEAERYFEELVRTAAKDLGELAEPLIETLFNQAGLPPSQLGTLHAVSPAFAARILPELEAAAARYIGQHRAQRLRQRLAPLAQTA
jgi:hypothetical protein